MSKPKTRTAALLLGCILLLTGTLLACENVPNIPDVSGSSAAESSSDDSSEPERKLSAEEWLETLPERDYTGTVFTIAATETGYVVPADEEEPGLVDIAAVKRNELIAAKYGVDIQEKALKTGTLATELKNARAAGVSYADAVLAPARDLAAAAAAGELLNLYSLPYFDLSADYMTKPLATDGVIHNTCYAVYGSATGAENSAWVVYYNRTLLSGAGYDEMERLAASGVRPTARATYSVTVRIITTTIFCSRSGRPRACARSATAPDSRSSCVMILGRRSPRWTSWARSLPARRCSPPRASRR